VLVGVVIDESFDRARRFFVDCGAGEPKPLERSELDASAAQVSR
jgi:hypothetical protein